MTIPLSISFLIGGDPVRYRVSAVPHSLLLSGVSPPRQAVRDVLTFSFPGYFLFLPDMIE